MAIDYKKILKGIILRNPTDQSKQLLVEVSNSATTATTTSIQASQTANRTVTLPDATTVLVGTDATQTLTNKTIDADSNTITNIDNNEIKANAAIDATKIADGSISNTEFQYLNGLNANIQDQLDDAGTDLTDHINDATGAHAASAIAVTASGNLAADDVQEALVELQLDIDTRALASSLTDHINDATDAHAASAITNTPAGNLVATTVQAAINELDTEKANLDLSNLSGPTQIGVNLLPYTDNLVDIGTNLLRFNDAHITNVNSTSVTAPTVAGVTTLNGTAIANYLTTTGTQAVTNKDIDGGTASNSNRITLPKNTLTNLQGLTRKQATVFHDTTSNKPYYDDGTNVKPIATGAGDTVNLIADGDAEAANIFVAYADSASSRPTDGTGGSPTVTATISSSSPLAGLNSFILTKDASNRQGQGIAATTITVDPAYKAKVMQIEFDYIVGSGTFVAGTSTTDSDVIVYIYDVTNSTLIEPSSIKLLSNSSTNSDRFIANFQTSMTGTSYRLILHCATTSASAYTLKIDNVKIKPCNYVYGTPISDWSTVTMTGSWVSNTTYTARSRRVGDEKEYDVTVATSGAPTSANLTINLPSGDVIDSTKLSSTNNKKLGDGIISDTGTDEYAALVSWSSTTAVTIRVYKKSAGNDYVDFPQVTQAVPMTWANTDYVNLHFTVPIVGLSSSVQMSDGYDGREIVFSASTTPGALAPAATTWTTLTWTGSNYDSVSGFNGTDTYTVKSAGTYEIQILASTNAATANFLDVGYRIDGGSDVLIQRGVGVSGSGSAVVSGTAQLKLNAEQTIQARAQTGDTSGINLRRMTIKKLQAPTTISATEVVALSVSGSTTTAAGAATTISWLQIDDNSHGAFASNEFTVPVSGRYCIELAVRHNTGGTASVNQYSLGYIQTNLAGAGYNTVRQCVKYVENSGVGAWSSNASWQGQLKAGDKVRFQHETNITSPQIGTSPLDTYAHIRLVK